MEGKSELGLAERIERQRKLARNMASLGLAGQYVAVRGSEVLASGEDVNSVLHEKERADRIFRAGKPGRRLRLIQLKTA